MPPRSSNPRIDSSSDLPIGPVNKVPWISPRIWHGMSIRTWGKLMAQNRYRIDRWPMAVLICVASGYATVANRVQHFFFAKRAADTPLVRAPVFVIGHWRSGTTFLHELFTLDTSLASPSTFQCFVPDSFLVSEPWLRPLTTWMLPKRRPMDNMLMSWNVPQEDEFALLTMGVPTTYRRIAFPNNPALHTDYLNMKGVPQSEIEFWKRSLDRFINYLNYYYAKPLVLKSPPHTGRIRTLLELYPQAKFVHITRHPYKFIPSTIHMWAALDATNALQYPRHEYLRDYVFKCFDRLYEGFDRDRPLLGPHNFINLRFEELVNDPSAMLRRIYNQFDLGDYTKVASQVRQRMEQTRDYKSNKHVLTPDLREEIDERCRQYMEQFGYVSEAAAA